MESKASLAEVPVRVEVRNQDLIEATEQNSSKTMGRASKVEPKALGPAAAGKGGATTEGTESVGDLTGTDVMGGDDAAHGLSPCKKRSRPVVTLPGFVGVTPRESWLTIGDGGVVATAKVGVAESRIVSFLLSKRKVVGGEDGGA